MKGKDTCNTLKAIRLQIAQANGITYTPVECTHKGPCRGTCPRCEQEVSYIEQQLSLRKRLGKAVAVAGVALSALHPTLAQAQQADTVTSRPEPRIEQDSVKVEKALLDGEEGIVVRGCIVDEEGDPLIGASVMRKNEPGKKGVVGGCVTDVDGRFAIEVPLGSVLVIAYVGYKTVELPVNSEDPGIISLNMDEEVMGEVIVGFVDKVRFDDVYGHGGW